MDLKRQAEQQLQRADFNKYELPDITGISLPNAGPQAKARAFLRAAAWVVVRMPLLYNCTLWCTVLPPQLLS